MFTRVFYNSSFKKSKIFQYDKFNVKNVAHSKDIDHNISVRITNRNERDSSKQRGKGVKKWVIECKNRFDLLADEHVLNGLKIKENTSNLDLNNNCGRRVAINVQSAKGVNDIQHNENLQKTLHGLHSIKCD